MRPTDTEYPEDSAKVSKDRCHFAAEIVAALVGVLCFAGTMTNGYCHDDGPIVATNPQVVGSASWKEIWTSDYWGAAGETWDQRDLLYRPVAVTSFRIIHALFPGSVWPQHALNILLHAILAILVVRISRRWHDDVRVAWFSGLLFAALPIHCEVVDSVVGRADLLAALGVLSAMLFYMRTTRTRVHRVFWYFVVSLSVFVAMASKESGVVASICVLATDWFCRRQSQEGKNNRWFSAATLRRVCFLVVPVGVYVGLRLNAFDGAIVQSAPLTKTINVMVGAPVWQRVLGSVQLWGMYWIKTVWPRVLCIDYSINAVRLATGLFDPTVLAGLGVLILGALWAVRRARKGDLTVGCLLGLCVLCYLPTSNSFVLIRTFFAERVWYLPSVWAVMLIALGLSRVRKKRLVHAIFVVALATMVGRCWVRNGDWKNNRTLYAAAYRDHPNGAQALRLYGQVLVNQGEIDQGIVLLRRAIDIDLGYTDAYRALGRAYLALGKYKEALHFLLDAEMQAPGDATTQAALRRARKAVADRQGKTIQALRTRVANAPGDIEAHLKLVSALRDVGDLRGALDHLQKFHSRFAGNARWVHEQAVTLVMMNDLDQAINAYRQAVHLAPENVATTVELAMLLLERDKGGDVTEAWQVVRRAASIAPHDASVLVCQGELLAHDGKTKEAIRAYRRAIALEPSDSRRRNAMIARLRALGG